MRRYSYKKDYAWNPEIAYLAGLIASDGCLINDGRHLNITSKDIEIIDHFRQILGVKSKVSIKSGQYGTTAFHLTFSNVAFYDFLLAAGLTPAKSKTIGKLILPDKYYAEFLRGYFDGDGTVYGYWDKRWRSSFMYYCEFVSASHDFLLWLQSMNSLLLGASAGKIKPGTRAFRLVYAKKDSQTLFYCMYRDKNVPLLSRKHLKFVDFIETDPYAR
jgi:hypothetical protein